MKNPKVDSSRLEVFKEILSDNQGSSHGIKNNESEIEMKTFFEPEKQVVDRMIDWLDWHIQSENSNATNPLNLLDLDKAEQLLKLFVPKNPTAIEMVEPKSYQDGQVDVKAKELLSLRRENILNKALLTKIVLNSGDDVYKTCDKPLDERLEEWCSALDRLKADPSSPEDTAVLKLIAQAENELDDVLNYGKKIRAFSKRLKW